MTSIVENGTNLARRLAPLKNKPEGTLVVHEFYRSIQGESTFAGLPCIFLRLAACHLRCGYCDTPRAFGGGESWTLDAIEAKVVSFGDRLVEITGGEPLLQPEVFPLMTRLADAGLTVLLETSGSLDIAPVDPRVRIILDVKTPGSGESDANLWKNLDLLKKTDEVKFVLVDRDDFDWALDVIRERGRCERCAVWMRAAFGKIEPVELAEWILESRLSVRYQTQLHKQIWAPNAIGV
ncbi:MAG: 7-carboxy-7-deazaguanine synthase QueE [Isosphaeraceae bacterium]